jgi:NHL repeat
MTFAQTARRAVAACTIAVLAACGQSPPTPNTVPPAQSDSTPLARAGCPSKRCIIVGSESGYKGKPAPAVLFFGRSANGNASPVGEISGSKTMLGPTPAGLAMDSHGNIYVANITYTADSTITVYAAGAEGNVAPIRTIAGTKTLLNHPAGIAIDSQDELYVANQTNLNSRITIYASNANGDVAPIRTIGGKKTGLNYPWGLAFDSQSNLYVGNQTNPGSVTVYAPTANGNAAPLRTIAGLATKLAEPAGLAVDASGYLYAVDTQGYQAVVIFAPGSNGNATPSSYFTPVQLYSFGIALDRRNNMYVTSVGYDDAPSVAAFAAGTNGNEGRVLRTIIGKKTKLIFPKGVIVN